MIISKMIRYITFSVLLCFFNYSFADPTDYLCKVSGSFYDLEGKGILNETVSLSLDVNLGYTFIRIIGSEHTETTMSSGAVGKSHSFDSGPSTSSWGNSSSGSLIDVTNGWNQKKSHLWSQSRFGFNQKTKMLSFSSDTYKDINVIAHINYSGLCVKP